MISRLGKLAGKARMAAEALGSTGMQHQEVPYTYMKINLC